MTAILRPTGSNIIQGTTVTTFSGSATSLTDITNMNVTIEVGASSSVLLYCASTSTSTGGSFSMVTDGAAGRSFEIQFVRTSTPIARYFYQMPASETFHIPGSAFMYIDDSPGAGTYTYKVQYVVGDANDTFSVTQLALVAAEI